MSIEGLESTTGDDKIGGDAGANVLKNRPRRQRRALWRRRRRRLSLRSQSRAGRHHRCALRLRRHHRRQRQPNSTLYTATWTDLGFGAHARGQSVPLIGSSSPATARVRKSIDRRIPSTSSIRALRAQRPRRPTGLRRRPVAEWRQPHRQRRSDHARIAPDRQRRQRHNLSGCRHQPHRSHVHALERWR